MFFSFSYAGVRGDMKNYFRGFATEKKKVRDTGVDGMQTGMRQAFESRRGQETFLQNFQTGSGAHPRDNACSFSEDITTGGGGGDSRPSTAKLKNTWSYTSDPPHTLSWREQGSTFSSPGGLPY